MALAFARPRIVEGALAVSTVQPDEADELRPAWHGVRAVVAIRPATLKVSSWAQLETALPNLRDPAVGHEPRPPQVIIRTEHAQLRFERDLAAALDVPRVDLVGDALTPALIERKAQKLEHSTGRCACGRKALILARCRQCAQDAVVAEAQELGESPGVAALAGVRGTTQEGLLVGSSTQRVTAACDPRAFRARLRGYRRTRQSAARRRPVGAPGRGKAARWTHHCPLGLKRAEICRYFSSQRAKTCR